MHHKILIVGADVLLMNSRKLLLESAGYHVEIASGDHAAMQQLTEDRFDMVVLGPSIPPRGFEQLEDRVRQTYPHAFIVKVQHYAHHRGHSPDAFVDCGMPVELLNAITMLFEGTELRVSDVIPPIARA